MSRKIIIREDQFDRVANGVDEPMRYSIALWCLLNDFRYLSNDNVFGRRVSVANTERINREICLDVMNANSIHEVENDGIFDDNSIVYSVDGMLIEVSSDITPDYLYDFIEKYENGDIDDEYVRNLVGWFSTML